MAFERSFVQSCSPELNKCEKFTGYQYIPSPTQKIQRQNVEKLVTVVIVFTCSFMVRTVRIDVFEAGSGPSFTHMQPHEFD